MSVDSLQTRRLSIPLTILFTALIITAIVLGGSALVGTNNAHAGLRAAILLVLWYGARGVTGSLDGPLPHQSLVAEYRDIRDRRDRRSNLDKRHPPLKGTASCHTPWMLELTRPSGISVFITRSGRARWTAGERRLVSSRTNGTTCSRSSKRAKPSRRSTGCTGYSRKNTTSSSLLVLRGYGLSDREHPIRVCLLRERSIDQRDVHRR